MLPPRQFIYQLESLTDINARIPGTTDDFGANDQGRSIGVSAIVAINDHEFLIIERDNRGIGADNPGGTPVSGSKRVYTIDINGATDVSGISLTGSNTLPHGVTPVTKGLYLDIQMALIGGFEAQHVPEPATLTLLGASLLGLIAKTRRRG
jgi:hypothetical protein